MKKLFPIIVIGILGVGAMWFVKSDAILHKTVPLPSATSQEVGSPTVGPVNTQEIVATFLQHIAQKRIAEAVLMMTKNAVPDDTAKQAWEMQFNAFKKLTVQSIEPSMQSELKDAQKTYRVMMDIEMNEDSADEVIPYFGYVNGINVRWIIIEKEGAEWKIAGISTGP